MIAVYEPVYCIAHSYFENVVYRKAYYDYDEVISGTENSKLAIALKNKPMVEGNVNELG